MAPAVTATIRGPGVIRILLAEDHALVRAGIRMLVESLEGMAVVAECENGHQAVEETRRTRPHVVLMDITMPGLNGLDATARISGEMPDVRVLILSMHASEEYVSQALRAGATGYLLKGGRPEELELAIRSAMRGESYLTPAVSRKLVDDYLRRVGAHPGEGELLTSRQREVLQLIAEGLSTKQVASKLKRSVKTVENHRNQIMHRLAIHDVAGLVRYAIRIGLISAED